jgi:hypothetical protein
MTENIAPVEFGDEVRFRANSHTIEAGISGLDGTVHGFTTPSSTGIEAVGPLADDFAINVYVDSLSQGFWIDPSMVELVHRPEVMEFGVAGKTIRVTRTADGSVEEVLRERPWWKFW